MPLYRAEAGPQPATQYAKAPKPADAGLKLLGKGKAAREREGCSGKGRLLGKGKAARERESCSGKGRLLGKGKAGRGLVAMHNRLGVRAKTMAETRIDNGQGTGTMERQCVVSDTIGGRARPLSKVFTLAEDDLIVKLVLQYTGPASQMWKYAFTGVPQEMEANATRSHKGRYGN
jgi:hypothetical protein